MTSLTIFDATKTAQAAASDPALSVFVAANAGSGKTHVLTERVVRLLLSGAEPSRILCLTYTKAAAAEMSTRVFARLSGWATASEVDLSRELKSLTGKTPDARRLAEARRLFARALETPGGLKIQTIHAFCEAILHQFPLEANVPGHFEVLDDAESALLIAEARRLLIAPSAGATHGAERQRLAEAFSEALALCGEWGLDRLIGEIVRKRDPIRRHVEEAGGLDAAVALLRRALGIAEGEDEAGILAASFPAPGLDGDFCASLRMVAEASDKAKDLTLASRLGALADAEDGEARFAALKSLCLRKDGAPYATASLAAKATVDFFEDFGDRFAAAAEHIGMIEDRLATLRLYRASAAALVIADRLERDYASIKRRRGRLDFEDLIVRTADLLSRSEAADWVHYKLDQGIDHVLIDEAQDTSPRQWQVVRSLVQEFFVGASSRNEARTVFAVGDEKQSIYSFQGASPAMFAEERRALETRAGEASVPFQRVALHQSFRSAADVLKAVDIVFSDPANRQGLSSEAIPPEHQSARAEPGLVEVWPVFRAEAQGEAEDWLQPIDVQPENAPANRLARRIAAQVKEWLGEPIVVKGVRRAITPGDVLVLVRKRSGFVEAMGAALREAGVAVAGADRLVLTDHIAVQDLMALGRVVANAEDELSLAAVLKSPLFGFSDDELMALALSRAPRDALYLALRRLAGPEGETRLPDFVPEAERARLREKAAIAFDRLEVLRGRAGFESVFSFYARILGPEGGRVRLTARLGEDAGEVIDAFLDLALAAEDAGQPDLDAFLADLSTARHEIKREMDHGKGEVRIMTVHASKGLEAPIVFLVDPGSAPFSHIHGARLMAFDAMPGLFPGQAPGFLWRADKSVETAVTTGLKEAEKRRAEDEYRRLLYVGMTRAADRLVICGTAGVRGPHQDSWLQRVQASLGPACEEVKDEAGTVTAWRLGERGETAKLAPAAHEAESVLRPIDLSPLPAEAPPPRPLTPSSAGLAHRIEVEDGVMAVAGRFASPVLSGAGTPSFAIRRGLAIHRLLQVLPDLPAGEREAGARRYLEGAAADFPPAETEAAIASVMAVLSDPAFAPIFSPGSRAEVAVSGTLELAGRPYAVSGTIDRMRAGEDGVFIVDYKTNRPAPQALEEVPPAYVLQLALYRQILTPLYPGQTIRAGLLFTETPQLVEIDALTMQAALDRRAGLAQGAAVPAAHGSGA